MLMAAAGYTTRYSVMFNYQGGRRQTLRLFNRTKITAHLRAVTRDELVPAIVCDREEPLDGVEKFLQSVRHMNLSPHDAAVTIDISTFTKQYLLVLLRELERVLKPAVVRLLYTEPAHYGRGGGQRLTYGVKREVIVPGYMGEIIDGERVALIVFLGYELHRSLAAIERYEPDLLVAVIGNPPYYEGWDRSSLKAHEWLLAKPDVVRVEMPTREPCAVAAQLGELCTRVRADFPNVYISPTGTKLQTVGIYEFVRQNRFPRLVYVIPEGYLESYYSIGCGETWEYYLSGRGT